MPSETSIIQAALKLSQPRWTSQTVAEHLGTSQSAVARVWRKYFDSSCLPEELPSGLQLTEICYVNGCGFIRAKVLDANPIGKILKPEMRSPRRNSLQTLLAGLPAHKASTNFASPQSQMPASILPDNRDWLLIHSDEKIAPGATNRIFINSEDWQSLLGYLISACHLTPAANLHELHQNLIQWAKVPSETFHWVASNSEIQLISPQSRPRNLLRSTQQVIADQVFESIVTNVWNGKLTAGDRVTESSLAKELRTTRNQTRDALRSLASSGLVDHHPVRGVLVPTPKVSDVIDIYAARRALGIEILHRAVDKPDFQFGLVAKALAELLETASTGNSYETGNADLHFQDVIAQNSGMRNIPQLFEILAKQLRIYIAVMGMGYIYSIGAMVADDTEIFRLMESRNFPAVRDAWNKKISDSLEFMTEHINSRK